MILLTGGAGYIGSHTLLELLNHEDEVLVVDNFSNSNPDSLTKIAQLNNKKFYFEEVDICDQTALTACLQNYPIQAVIHFAAYKAVGDSVAQPLNYYRNNLVGLINILDYCAKKQINHFVFSSSCTVYGVPQKSPVTEEFEIQTANSPYGNTKQIGEEIIRDFAFANPTFNYLNLRYFNPIGAHESGLIGDDPTGIPNNLIPYLTKVAFGELAQLKVFGGDYATPDGTCIRDYIHVVDLAKAHVLALHQLKQHQINLESRNINIGTGVGYSVLEVINCFEKVSKLKLNYTIVDKRSGDVPAIYADPSKAKNSLNWEAQYTLEDMLRSAWNFQLKNAKK